MSRDGDVMLAKRSPVPALHMRMTAVRLALQLSEFADSSVSSETQLGSSMATLLVERMFISAKAPSYQPMRLQGSCANWRREPTS